jgi:predicted dehydrogenase
MIKHFSNLKVVACADLFPEKTVAQKEKYGLEKTYSVETLLKDPEIDIVVNLTIPAAHYPVNSQIIDAGKHCYCEKPLALNLEEAQKLVSLAEDRNVIIGNAPDTFMGPGIQTCRTLIDNDEIGNVFGFTANLVSPGHDLWHPGPEFYYKKGAGPMFDMGPYYITALVSVFGPIESINCYALTVSPKRMIKGKEVEVEVYTHYVGILEFKNGIIGNINMSFDVWDSDLPLLEVYGVKGKLVMPDPNTFNGNVSIIRGEKVADLMNSKNTFPEKIEVLYGSEKKAPGKKALIETIPLPYDVGGNMRGLGVSDMAAAIEEDRPHRASGTLAMHVVEALNAFNISAHSKTPYIMKTSCKRPEPVSFVDTHWVD